MHFENAVTMPAFQVEKDTYIVKRLNDAYEAVRPGVTQPTGALAPQCFYGSDAGHLYKTLGMQGVVCGPGGKYNTMPDERVEVGWNGVGLYGKACGLTGCGRCPTIWTASRCSSGSLWTSARSLMFSTKQRVGMRNAHPTVSPLACMEYPAEKEAFCVALH